MRQILILAVGITIFAGGARAQTQAQTTWPGYPKYPTFPTYPGEPKVHTPRPPAQHPPAERPPTGTYNPVAMPKVGNIYDNGPFSPAGEAKRQRQESLPLAGSEFSPAAEAKRQRDEAKRFHPF